MKGSTYRCGIGIRDNKRFTSLKVARMSYGEYHKRYFTTRTNFGSNGAPIYTDVTSLREGNQLEVWSEIPGIVCGQRVIKRDTIAQIKRVKKGIEILFINGSKSIINPEGIIGIIEEFSLAN